MKLNTEHWTKNLPQMTKRISLSLSDVSLGQQLRGEIDQSISRVTRLLSNNGLITVLCLEFRMQCNAPTLDIRYKRCGVVDVEGRMSYLLLRQDRKRQELKTDPVWRIVRSGG